jgi:hypothetical protein
MLRDEATEVHVNPDAPRFNFGFDQPLLRAAPPVPDRLFLNDPGLPRNPRGR